MWVQASASLPHSVEWGLAMKRGRRAREEGLEDPEASTAKTQQQTFPLGSALVVPRYFFLFHTEDFSLEIEFN